MHWLWLYCQKKVSSVQSMYVSIVISNKTCREAIPAHCRAAGEVGVGSYRDPALDDRIDQEARECRLPHQNPWTGPRQSCRSRYNLYDRQSLAQQGLATHFHLLCILTPVMFLLPPDFFMEDIGWKHSRRQCS